MGPKGTTARDEVPSIIREIYALTERLEQLFPGRKFTPDGHLVGSIGEVLAAHDYELQLQPGSLMTHDAISVVDRRQVQIKATSSKSIGLRSQPEHLLVLQINRDGSYEEIFNGPGAFAWDLCGPMQRNGQRSVSVTKLRAHQARVEDKLPRRRAAPIIS